MAPKKLKRIKQLEEELVNNNVKKKLKSLKNELLFVEEKSGKEINPIVNNKRKKVAPPPLEETDPIIKESPSVKKQINRVKKALKNNNFNEEEEHENKIELKDYWATGEAGLPPLPHLGALQLKRMPKEAINEWTVKDIPRISIKKNLKIHSKPSTKYEGPGKIKQ